MVDRNKWMEELGPQLAKKTLRQLVIPGAHDAGTSPITEKSEWSPDIGALSPLRKLPKYRVAEWSRAQGWTVYQQLMYGIRYLDLRVAKDDVKGRFYFTHTLLGDFVEERIYNIRSFLSVHTKEIVILDFQHLINMNPGDHQRLARMLSLAFGNKLLAPPSTGHPLPTMETLWNEGKQVIALYNDDPQSAPAFKTNPFLWQRDRIRSFWCDSHTVNDLRPCLQREVDNPPPPNKLFVLQGVLSPRWTSLFKGSLQTFAASSNGVIISWFVGPWVQRGLNILMVDWMQFGDVVGRAIQLNSSVHPE